MMQLSLQSINKALSGKIGDDYCIALVDFVGRFLDVDYVFIANIVGDEKAEAETRAVFAKGQIVENFTYSLAGTPCAEVSLNGVCCFTDSVQGLYPEDYLLQEMSIEGYMGASLIDSTGHSMGVLVVLHETPIKDDEKISSVFDFVVARTAAELERMRADNLLREALQEAEKVKEELVRREAELRCHIDNTPLGCISWDLDLCCISWNSSAERIFGYTAEEALGKHATDLIVPRELRDTVDVIFKDLINKKGGFRNTNENFTKSGQKITGDWYNTPIMGANGHVTGVTSLVLDVTDRIENSRRLKEAKNQAERANKAKSTFLANLSHEFRTPLNAILGYSDLIEHQLYGPVGHEKYLQHARNIHLGGKHMLDLVNDILDMSAIETGNRNLIMEKVKLNELLVVFLEEISSLAEQKKLTISANYSDVLPLFSADKRSIHQIVSNLVSNAIKYTKPGGKVLVSTSSDDEYVTFTIEDSGVGIPKDEIEKVMEPFVQIQNIAYLAEEGTGLGLSIVKSLVELHNGLLEIQSEVDIGTTVKVSFPI